MSNKRTSFWRLLSDYKICIPKIQRDYAQGRKGKEYFRKKFLGHIKNALTSNNYLQLDFIYGAEEDNRVTILDGQQRLTTLWLLHWFIAFKSGHIKESREIFNKFSYETRKTAREFTHNLCKTDFSSVKCHSANENLRDLITIQNWYLHVFDFDPTVQGMLRMLSSGGDDCIENIFSDIDFQSAWNLLTSSEENCPIRFYFKDMSDNDLPQTDDLYIKMNSRGRQLTDFENFKAEFFGYKYKNESGEETAFFDMSNTDDYIFISNFENKWTQLFWHFKHPERFVIDDIYLEFINRFVINYFITKSEKDEQNKKSDRSKNFETFCDNLNNFNGIEQYKPILTEDFKKTFARTLNGICKVIKERNGSYDFLEDKRISLIPQYKEKDTKGLSVRNIDYVERPVVFAACKYFEILNTSGEQFQSIFYNDWIRFTWNIAHNSEVEGNVSNMIAVIREINKFSSSCLHIIDYLAKQDSEKLRTSNSLQRQIKEEFEKAGFISKLRNDKLNHFGISEQIIYDAEGFSFFNGAIRFLFHDENGKIDWSNFVTKWKYSRKYFANDKNKINSLLLRNLVYNVKDLNTLLYNVTFDSSTESWRAILLDEKLSEPVNKILMGEILDDETLSKRTSPLKGIQRQAHEDLYRTKLLEYTTWDTFKLRQDGCPYRLMPYNSKKQSKRYNIGNIRNKLLAVALKEGKIELKEKRQFDDSGFFWGDNIDFLYKGSFFRCYVNHQGNDDNEIYLMHKKDDDSLDYYISKENKYVMKNIKSADTNVDMFCAALDEMINIEQC